MKRPVVNPTPVALDREAIMDYVGLLADDVIARSEEVATKQELGGVLDDHAELLRSTYGVNDPNTDEWIDVPIIVSSEATEGGLIVASMVNENPFCIEIVVNGSEAWSRLRDERETFVKQLYACLMRELITVVEDQRVDDVEDFVQDFTDEALARAETFNKSQRHGAPTRDMVLDYVRKGESFVRRLPVMKPRDRAKAMKAVYSALIDAGLV